VSEEADEVRIAIPRGTDPLSVLDGARAAGRVDDFGLDLPSLSQLFLESVGPAKAPGTPDAPDGSARSDGSSRSDTTARGSR
jgi:ABC-2 type transport system ATP-binding protein